MFNEAYGLARQSSQAWHPSRVCSPHLRGNLGKQPWNSGRPFGWGRWKMSGRS